MLNNYSDDQLRLAAQLYYVDNLAQAEVAKFVKVSQAGVSRLLNLARARGIVRISVSQYEPRHCELEARLKDRFGLNQVAVIKTVEGLSGQDVRRAVTHFAASFVSTLIPPHALVALAGGRTLRELVDVLPPDLQRRPTIIQAMGSIDSNISPVDAQEIGRTLAQRCGGSFLALNTPAFVQDKKTRDALLALDQIRAVQQRMAEADAALIGIGTLENSVFAERGVLSAIDLETLREADAVGEICGRFFNRQGRECETAWRDCVISIRLEQLRKVPQVVGVVTGSDRSLAIAAAIRGGILKSLVIDEAGATGLIAEADKSRPKMVRSKISK